MSAEETIQRAAEIDANGARRGTAEKLEKLKEATAASWSEVKPDLGKPKGSGASGGEDGDEGRLPRTVSCFGCCFSDQGPVLTKSAACDVSSSGCLGHHRRGGFFFIYWVRLADGAGASRQHHASSPGQGVVGGGRTSPHPGCTLAMGRTWDIR